MINLISLAITVAWTVFTIGLWPVEKTFDNVLNGAMATIMWVLTLALWTTPKNPRGRR